MLIGFNLYCAPDLIAQSREIEDKIERIKQRSNVVYVQVSSDLSKQDAEEKAMLELKESVLQRYGSNVAVGSGSIDDLQLKLELKKVGLDARTFYWDRRRDHYIFAYVEEEQAQQYVIDRATFAFRDPDSYTFSNATHPDEETALNQARANLITQFQVTVQAEQRSQITEVNGEVNDKFSSQTRAFSKMSLIGLKTMTFNIGDNTYAFAYISHEDKEESFAAAKNRVLSLVQEGERQWNWGNYSRAVNNYYRAYILSDAYYKPITYEFSNGNSTKDLQETLRLKVEEFFQTMEVDVRPAYEIAEQDIVAPFKLKKEDDLVNRVTYKYEVQGYSHVNQINYGKGKLEFTNYYPNERVEVFPVEFGIDISQELESDPVLRELEPARKFFVSRPIQVDFSNVFKVTIQAYFDGVDITYSVETRNLVATTAQWDFGDGETTVGLNPEHSYKRLGVFPVNVVVNGDSKLSDTKYLDLEQGILRNDPPQTLLASAESTQTPSSAPTTAQPTPSAENSSQPLESEASVKDSVTTSGQDSSDDTSEQEEESKQTALVKQVSDVKQETYRDYITDTYKKITEYRSLGGLSTTLKRLQKKGTIEYGKQSSLFDSEGALVIVADLQKGTVIDFLIFKENRYIRTKTGEEMTNLNEKYSGKRTLWVKETE
ncbi:MAG: PKD domain-containing protein [Bacteroidota bacterium]